MKIQIADAEELAKSALQRLGYSASNAEIIAHHVIDSELRGYSSAGLARILSIRDRLSDKELRQEVVVTREAPATMQLDGQDSVGYLVARRATEEAIRKAQAVGVGIVGASNTWYTGMLAYYAEMAAKSDLVTIIASNTSPWVAASGGYRPIFGTNPFAIGFPSSKIPVIFDMGTSRILHADVLLAQRLGTELPAQSAYNATGEFTKNPIEALEGAIAVWGGHRGSGLALAVQLLGVLAGSPALPANLEDFGFLIVAINPANFQPMEKFKEEIDHFAKSIKESPSLNSDSPLRVPFERSAALRAKNVSLGEFEVEDRVVEMLRSFA